MRPFANITKKLSSFVMRLKHRETKRIFLSMIVAFLIIAADYFAGNLSYPIFDSSTDLSLQAYLHDYRDDNDNFFAVNTAMDISLAVALNQYGDTCGHVAVTNRHTLAKFLDIAKKSDYRYIFLDIRFDSLASSPEDSLLISRIIDLPHIVFSRHRDESDGIKTPELLEKGAYADFRTIRSQGFSRYEFIQDGHKSVALKMYEDIDGKGIHSTWWGGYADNDGAICRNLQFVPFPKKILLEEDNDNLDAIMYPLLGAQHLAIHSEDELIRMLHNKVILIGDFNNDTHDTYIGEVSGPLLSYYAWRVLERGNHKVNLWLQFFLFVLYTLVIYIILLPSHKIIIKNPLVVLIMSILGWSTALWVLKSIIYWFFGLSFLVIIPSITFSVITTSKEVYLLFKQKRTSI